MLKRSSAMWELMSGINVGRLRLAEQFSTMDGWQHRQDDRFDQYVKERRQKQYFDTFDQRVERAFRIAAKAHKTEVKNAFKRKVKASNGKWTAAVMLEVKAAVEERLRWLRDVWMQIDADYRSSDPERQQKAAQEISDALRGDPGAYMQWVYDRKREDRFLGPKEKAAHEVELSAAELPEVSEDEANRYHGLSLRMADIEYSVKSRFGLAGQQHWAELQAAKDDAYEKKLDTAAKVYEQLLDQSARYDESRRTALLRSNVERVHQAQLRFKASMELEKEREKLMEAHEAMEAERKARAKEERVAILHEAAELRKSGATSEEAQQLARQRQLEAHARRQAEYQLQEREMLHRKKSRYLDMIEKFREDVERREGEELLQPPSQTASSSHELRSQAEPLWQRAPAATDSKATTLNAFGFMEGDRLAGGNGDEHEPMSQPQQLQQMDLARPSASSTDLTSGVRDKDTFASSAPPTASAAVTTEGGHARKRDLWKAINEDTYEDPFRTIHQARLDAAATYDTVYEKHFPVSLAQGKKYSKQGMGEMAAGGGMDKQVLKQASRVMLPYQWGMSSPIVHDIDGDGSMDYYYGPEWHVRHPETGDVDWRYERKKGGAVFRGPRLYRIGAEREAADPGYQSVDPSPATVKRFVPETRRRGAASVASPRTPPPLSRSPGRVMLGSPSPREALQQHSRTTPPTPSLPTWRST